MGLLLATLSSGALFTCSPSGRCYTQAAKQSVEFGSLNCSRLCACEQLFSLDVSFRGTCQLQGCHIAFPKRRLGDSRT